MSSAQNIRKFFAKCIAFALLLSLVIINLAQATSHNAIFMKQQDTQLIPRTVLFGNPDKLAVSLSPNGEYLAYIGPLNGVLNIYLAKLPNFQQATPITHDTKRGIRNYHWSYNNEQIIYEQDKDGDEDWHLYAVTIKTQEVRDLTPFKGVHAMLVQDSLNYPNKIVVALNNRRKDLHDLYLIDSKSGQSNLLFQNDTYASLTVDDQYELRFGSKQMSPEGIVVVDKFLGQKKPPEEFMRLNIEDSYMTHFVDFDKNRNKVYIADTRGRNTSGLFECDLQSNKQTLLFGTDLADISGALIHPTEKNIQAAYYDFEKTKIAVLDPAIQKDIEFLQNSFPDREVRIVSQTLSNEIWVVVTYSDVSPPIYSLFDRKNEKLTYLFSGNKALSESKLTPMHPVIIKSRDGLNLVSYLSLPTSIQANMEPVRITSNKKPDTFTETKVKTSVPVPLILYVHGGPNARDVWGINSVHQWLANRGYAVLSVNYRGSTGFGKNFIIAGNGEWAGKAHDDLIDAVNWAITNGVTSKDAVGIMGGSYGGYAVLVGLTFTPDTFACGVDIVGPSNLLTLMRTVPSYWKPFLNELKIKIGGDPDTEAGRRILSSKSPLTYVNNIKKPLMIGQGANDPRVKRAESEQIVDAMKRSNIPVTYILYPDEGHGFARPENKLSFFAMTEYFLAGCLGGKVEASTFDFPDSSMQILHGEEFLSKKQSITKTQ